MIKTTFTKSWQSENVLDTLGSCKEHSSYPLWNNEFKADNKDPKTMSFDMLIRNVRIILENKGMTLSTFTYSKLPIETLEQGVKYVQS